MERSRRDGAFLSCRLASVASGQSPTGHAAFSATHSDSRESATVAGLIVLAKGSQKLAATLVTVPLAVALVVGFGAHFLSSGNDNVLHMPPGALLLSFQISAVLLMVLEAAGVLLGLQMFGLGKEKTAPSSV